MTVEKWPAIKVRHLQRSYNGNKALDNISFQVFPGEVFGYLGPNGAGKTTTIKILTGQLRPGSGDAWIFGRHVVKDRQRIKSMIGVVFEYQNIYERLSAIDNLRFIARLYGAPKQRVEEVLALVGLQKRAKEPIKKYSNGMKQRLMIARGLLHQPRVLFFDEPTRGLDPNVARGIRSLISKLSAQGVTIFLTTHYMEEADRLSDRVAIIDRGKIAALGTPMELKEQYSQGSGTTLEDVFVHLTGRPLIDWSSNDDIQ